MRQTTISLKDLLEDCSVEKRRNINVFGDDAAFPAANLLWTKNELGRAMDSLSLRKACRFIVVSFVEYEIIELVTGDRLRDGVDN